MDEEEDLLAAFEPDEPAPPREGYSMRRRVELDPIAITGRASRATSAEPRFGDMRGIQMGVGGRSIVEEGPKLPPRDSVPMDRVQRMSAANEAARHSPLWDTLISPVDGAARGRNEERAHSVWDELTSGDARLGGRNAIDPIVGRDERGAAPIAGMVDVLGGLGDEAAGAATALRGGEYRAGRDAAREREERIRTQAPSTYLMGQGIGTAALAAAPIGRAAEGAGFLARAGRSALAGGALGGAEAFGHSEDETALGLARDTGMGVAGGALMGVAGEAIAAPARLATGAATGRLRQRLLRGADEAQNAADQARLEASGFWGQRAKDALEDTPGGRAAVAADLRRMRIGERPGIFNVGPRADRAAEDLERLRRTGGATMDRIVEDIDGVGIPVSTSRAAERVQVDASELERLPIGGRPAAQRLRELAGDLSETPEIPMRSAWQQRQLLDQMRGNAADPSITTIRGQLGNVRSALSDEMQSTADLAGRGADWRSASRDTQLGILSRDYGNGAARLSQGGGIQGAAAAAELTAGALAGGPVGALASFPGQMAARAISQESRMRFPGIATRFREGQVSTMRSIAERLSGVPRVRPELVERFGPQLRALQEAAQRGTTALGTTLYIQSQTDPATRQLLEELQSEEMGGDEDEFDFQPDEEWQ